MTDTFELLSFINTFNISQSNVPVLEQLETTFEKLELLDSHITSIDSTSSSVFTPFHWSMYLLCSIHLNHLNKARHLWKRIPSCMKQNQMELNQIWEIGKHLWTRNLEGSYTVMDQTWSETIQPWILSLRTAVQQRAASLISRAYTSIPTAHVTGALGLKTSEELVEYCQLHEWKIDGNFVYPKKGENYSVQQTDITQLKQLTEYIVHLEQATTLRVASKSKKSNQSSGMQMTY